MRYRRLGRRYAMVLSSGPGWLLGTVWSADPARQGGARWRPEADLYETTTTVEVVVDLAGVEEEDLDVQLFEDVLVVEGRRQLPSCEHGAVYHVAAIRQGPFRLVLPLSAQVDGEGVEARYDRGLLRVTLPKSERSG